MGGTIDTVAFNQRNVVWSSTEMAHYAALLGELEQALARQDPAGIGHVATESAQLWQRVNPKPALDEVLRLSRETGAAGVGRSRRALRAVGIVWIALGASTVLLFLAKLLPMFDQDVSIPLALCAPVNLGCALGHLILRRSAGRAAQHVSAHRPA